MRRAILILCLLLPLLLWAGDRRRSSIASLPVKPGGAAGLIAPTLTYTNFILYLINNDPGTPTLYTFYYSETENGSYSAAAPGEADYYEEGAPGWWYKGTVTIGGVESPFSNKLQCPP